MHKTRSSRAARRAALVGLALAGVGAGASPSLSAQQGLTLQEAVALAQAQGHRARAARATREAARHQHDAFRARLLPQLSLSGNVPSYTRAIIPVLQPDGTTQFRPQQQTDASLELELAQKLPLTGGDLFVSSSLARVNVSGQQPVETWSSTPVSVGLRQGLFRPNTAAWDRRVDNVRAELAERTYREALEDVALETTNAFFDLYAARVALENAVKNAAVNETLYTLNTGRLEVGKIGENDLLQSELALLRARATVEDARLEHDRAAAALRLVLNVSPGAPIGVAVPDAVPDLEPDTARAVAEALRNRAAVTAVELDEVVAERGVTEAKLAGGAGATVEASLGFNATAPQASLAYRNLLEARRFTLAVQVPLWRWGAQGDDVQAAEAGRDRSAALGRQALEQTAHDARFAALQLSQARRNVALRAKADTVAGKRFEVAYNRYVIGRITIDNLYIAQTEKDQALTQYVQALRGYWQAHYRLRRAALFDFAAGQPIR
jgi:outer membrane protein TolC